MALRHYRNEELNYFKFSSLVLNEFPKALRQTFRTMWDNVIGGRPGFQLWDDSPTVRNMFVSLEGGKTKVPTHKSYVEWDCTALFQATIYAQTFCSPHTHSTLSYLYVKPRHVSHGSFHSTVVSPGGNNAETSALAIDQLRLLRNSICHACSSELEKKTFDQYIQYAKDAFKALGLKTDVIDAVGGLTESDFPTAKLRDLEQGMREEARRYIEVLEDISELKSLLAALKEDTANKDNITILEQKIHDLIKSQEESAKTLKSEVDAIRRKVEGQTDILEGISSDNTAIKEEIVILQEKIDDIKSQGRADTQPKISGERRLPSMVPSFTGRQRECQEIVRHVTSASTRMLSICGSPGFGKTSVAIAVGHDLQSKGFVVCWVSLRGFKSKADLTLELLSLVQKPVANRQPSAQGMSIENELCQLFREISKECVFILDNADDLLESGESNIKDDLIELLKELLAGNERVKFILTTRESLKIMKLKFQGLQEIRIEPLDDASSQCLVHELLPNAGSFEVKRFTAICGNVPLAIQLLCSSISEDDDAQPSEFLETLDESSIVKMLDETDYPDSLRLLILFDSSFQRLLSSDKEALVSLSVLPANFDIEVCVAVLEKTHFETKKLLQRLRRKSLLGSISTPGTFTMHKLIQSFTREKGKQEEMKGVVLRSTARFQEFYVSRFEKLNEQFLTGNSMSAFVTFMDDKANFIQSLTASCSDGTRADRLFLILAKAELFLDSIFWCGSDGQWFDWIYDSALKAARLYGNDVHYRRLLVSKAFAQLTWGREGISPQLLCEVNKLHTASSFVPSHEKGKYSCYIGICQLVTGETENGVQHLQEAVSLMKNNPEEKVLKIIAFQILAVNYKFVMNYPSNASDHFYRNALQAANEVGDAQLIVIPPNERTKLETDVQTTLCNHPAKLQVIYHVQVATKLACNLETKMFQRDILLKTLHKVEKSLLTSGPALFSFHRVVVNMLKKFTNESKLREEKLRICQAALNNSRKRFGEDHTSTADCYYLVGDIQHELADFTSALQSKRSALEIRRTLHGEQHSTTADSYDSVGVTQHELEDFTSALQSKQRALEIRRTLFGEEHSTTAKIYGSVAITQHELGDFTSALQSKQRALQIRRTLFGEEHSTTAKSYDSVGITQHKLGDFTSALQSKQRALEIRRTLFGKEHSTTAESYDSVEITQHELGDFTSALQSNQRALEIGSHYLGSNT